MTPEAATIALIEAGFTPEEAQAVVSGIPANSQVLASAPALLQYAELQRRQMQQSEMEQGRADIVGEQVESVEARRQEADEAATNEATDLAVDDAIERAKAGDQNAVAELAARVESGDTTMDEVAAADAGIAALLAEATAVPMPGWVLAALPGFTEEDVNLVDLWNIMDETLELGPSFHAAQSDEDKELVTLQILAGGSDEAQIGVDLYRSQLGFVRREIDGFKHEDLQKAMERNQIDLLEALSTFKVAEKYGVENPVAFADVWNAAKARPTEQGTVPNSAFTGYGASTSGEFQTSDPGGRRSPRDRTVGAVEGNVPNVDHMKKSRAAMEYARGLEQYDGNHTLAAVYVSDPELAGRMFNDPYSLTAEDLGRVEQALGSIEDNENIQSNQRQWLMDRINGAFQSVQVDTTAAEESARSLAQAWNLPVNDSVLGAIAQQFASTQLAAVKASLGNPFQPVVGDPVRLSEVPTNPGAFATQALRETSIYHELFRHKTGAESEEQYAGRFQSEANQLLGDQDQTAIQAGMRTGDRNVVGQIALHGGGADSSTFLGRLAQLGQAFQEMT